MKDLPGVLTGAWQFSLKDMTNCGMLKSELCLLAGSLQKSYLHCSRKLVPCQIGHFIIICVFFSRIAFEFLIAGWLCFVDLREKRGFDYGKTMYQVHR